jgi:hypothetical protein
MKDFDSRTIGEDFTDKFVSRSQEVFKDRILITLLHLLL